MWSKHSVELASHPRIETDWWASFMVIYTVCLGMTLAVEASSREEAIEIARAELQHELDHGIAGQERGAWEFDMYDVSKMEAMDGVMDFEW